MRRPSREEVRDRLLAAAQEALVSHGYGSASVEVITEAAGLSRGALYSNFADKEALYVELLDRLEQRQIEVLSAAFHERGDLGGILDLLATPEHTASPDVRSHTVLHVELWLLAMRNEAVRSGLAAIQERSRQAIASAVAGVDIGLTPGEVASTVSAISDGLLMQRLLDPDAVRETLLVDVLTVLARMVGLLPAGGRP